MPWYARATTPSTIRRMPTMATGFMTCTAVPPTLTPVAPCRDHRSRDESYHDAGRCGAGGVRKALHHGGRVGGDGPGAVALCPRPQGRGPVGRGQQESQGDL